MKNQNASSNRLMRAAEAKRGALAGSFMLTRLGFTFITSCRITDHIRILTRSIVKLEVNEAVMARQMSLLKQEVDTARSMRQTSDASVLEVEAAYRQRVLYLEVECLSDAAVSGLV